MKKGFKWDWGVCFLVLVVMVVVMPASAKPISMANASTLQASESAVMAVLVAL